eukprot:4350364-Heterocapsa_arctica.AAC.1
MPKALNKKQNILSRPDLLDLSGYLLSKPAWLPACLPAWATPACQMGLQIGEIRATTSSRNQGHSILWLSALPSRGVNAIRISQ